MIGWVLTATSPRTGISCPCRIVAKQRRKETIINARSRFGTGLFIPTWSIESLDKGVIQLIVCLKSWTAKKTGDQGVPSNEDFGVRRDVPLIGEVEMGIDLQSWYSNL